MTLKITKHAHIFPFYLNKRFMCWHSSMYQSIKAEWALESILEICVPGVNDNFIESWRNMWKYCAQKAKRAKNEGATLLQRVRSIATI